MNFSRQKKGHNWKQENYKWESSLVETDIYKGRKSSPHKYDIKTSNHEKRKVQMQHTGSEFEIKGPAT